MTPAPQDSLPAFPIDDVLEELSLALARGHAVLSAPPGSGKTTRVPLAMLSQPWISGRSILMLEPRRPAARMSAARMAQLLGDTIGGTVGYQVRFERRIGAQTRIQVLTEGILTRRIQSDPELTGVGLLIFDEFHERSLQADLGLALALDAAGALREDLRILIMSATLDTSVAAHLLGGAPVIRSAGQAHPVELVYAHRAPDGGPAAAVAEGVGRALRDCEGDVLAFLPGAAEINRARERLARNLGDSVSLLPLHGSLPSTDQDRALRPGDGRRRRVVLATDIAETSLTIEGVTAVVDSGLARKPRFDPSSGLSRLVTEPISRASADQRAGRAGRLGPGTCFRLWTRDQDAARPAHRTAEILQADLTPLALELALWGVRKPADLPWLDPPPAAAWSRAVELLRGLEALDAAGAVTGLGRRMAEPPVHPRLARMLVAAPPGKGLRLAADLAALLSDRDPWVTSRAGPRPADLGLRLSALDAFRAGAKTAGMEPRRLAGAERVTRQLLRGRGQAAQTRGSTPTPGALLALAYPDRVAKRRPGPGGRYLLAGGGGAVLPPDDPLGRHELLVIADLEADRREGRIRLALPIADSDLRAVLGTRIESSEAVFWDEDRQSVAARRERRLGALVLDSRPVPLADPERATALLLERLEKGFETCLQWRPTVRQLQGRVALLRHLEPEAGWPDLSDDWLRTHLRDWLAPWLQGTQGLAEVGKLDLHCILRSRLPWALQQRLDQETPAALITPAGTRRPLDYTAGETPVLTVPLQEMFGATTTPTVCSGRIVVTLHLLSPARRPLQVTRDLASFWGGSYAQVRKEMRGRYPKHRWPEDPASESPVAGGLKRRP
jgi:ATP-dependent helicase HrpB